MVPAIRKFDNGFCRLMDSLQPDAPSSWEEKKKETQISLNNNSPNAPLVFFHLVPYTSGSYEILCLNADGYSNAGKSGMSRSSNKLGGYGAGV